MKIHVEENPYSCDTCGKGFKIHTLKPFLKIRCVVKKDFSQITGFIMSQSLQDRNSVSLMNMLMDLIREKYSSY